MAESEMPELQVSLADFAPQTGATDALLTPMREGRLSHANLITGARGTGKRTLARLMAQYLLCTAPADKPCGCCAGCVQAISGNHPDLLRLAPDLKKSRFINVDMIRGLNTRLATASYAGGARVVVIEQADAMNPQAQNALLKNLEEPRPGTIFLLLTEAPALLLPTIRSRCRAAHLYPWSDTVIDRVLTALDIPPQRRAEVLGVCGGSIGSAIELAYSEAYWTRRAELMADFFDLKSRSELLTVSEKWKKRCGKDKTAGENKESEEGGEEEEKPAPKAKAGDTATPGALLDDLEEMIRTLMLVRFGVRPQAALTGFSDPWQKLAREGETADFVRLLDAVAKTRQLQWSNVTWQALMEKLLLSLMEEKSKWLK